MQIQDYPGAEMAWKTFSEWHQVDSAVYTPVWILLLEMLLM
jgi:hypothetical protein